MYKHFERISEYFWLTQFLHWTIFQEFFELFKIEILVEDLNDNNPIFPNDLIKLELTENAAIGTLLRLDSATDADTVPFAIKRYTVDDQYKNYFELQQDDIDGSIIPQLKLIKTLDFEKRSIHKLTLTAFDGGLPPRTGSAQVEIKVVDVNDHVPEFEQDRFIINVPENLEVGDIVTVLNATDSDVGVNAKINYKYQNTLVEKTLREMFILEEDTGIIRIGKYNINILKIIKIHTSALSTSSRHRNLELLIWFDSDAYLPHIPYSHFC